MGMTEQYVKAMARSYENQKDRLTVPADQLGGILEIPIGFTPVGIVSQGQRIAIAAYFEPAICLAEVSSDEKGLHFQVSWIRGANHGIQPVRLFPDVWQPGQANRAQSVNFGPDGNLWITRNGDREFFILTPPEEKKGRWTLTGHEFLPGKDSVASALLCGDQLLTTEFLLDDLDIWFERKYSFPGFKMIEENPAAAYLYGIAIDGKGRKLTVTDYRSKAPRGIYADGKLIVPDVWGEGLCFVNEGMFMTKPGGVTEGPFNGEPSSLIFIPRKMLE